MEVTILPLAITKIFGKHMDNSLYPDSPLCRSNQFLYNHDFIAAAIKSTLEYGVEKKNTAKHGNIMYQLCFDGVIGELQ